MEPIPSAQGVQGLDFASFHASLTGLWFVASGTCWDSTLAASSGLWAGIHQLGKAKGGSCKSSRRKLVFRCSEFLNISWVLYIGVFLIESNISWFCFASFLAFFLYDILDLQDVSVWWWHLALADTQGLFSLLLERGLNINPWFLAPLFLLWNDGNCLGKVSWDLLVQICS